MSQSIFYSDGSDKFTINCVRFVPNSYNGFCAVKKNQKTNHQVNIIYTFLYDFESESKLTKNKSISEIYHTSINYYNRVVLKSI